MDRFEIVFRESVRKDVRSIPKPDLEKILERIRDLSSEPDPAGSSKLSGHCYYRIRCGNYRVVYEVQETK